MSKSNHPIEQEELMAYLDGELATNRAVTAAAHLEHCQECQELAADLRKLSQELMAWEVDEAGSAEMSTDVVVALEESKKAPKKHAGQAVRSLRVVFTRRTLSWAGGIAVFFLFVMAISIPNLLRRDIRRREWNWTAQTQNTPQSPKGGDTFDPSYGRNSGSVNGTVSTVPSDKNVAGVDSYNSAIAPPPPPPPAKIYTYDSLNRLEKSENIDARLIGSARDQTRSSSAAAKEVADDELDSSERTPPTVPMIARTAALTLTTKEFDKTRASLEEILKRHGGYLGELKVSAPADAGRTLTATLRIPAPQLESALAELKTLGRVEDESQGGEEVTQQYVDLQARLANGKHTEQRLTEILRQRTGKLQDVLKVELEIDRVRGEIEQMQAEKKELSKRVAFATLNTMVKEEYHARLQGAPPSTGSRFHNAAVDGYNTVVEGLIDIGLFLLSAGPSLLLWAAILFFPARWAWKKFQAARKRENVEEKI